MPFDPSTAKPVAEFDPTTAKPVGADGSLFDQVLETGKNVAGFAGETARKMGATALQTWQDIGTTMGKNHPMYAFQQLMQKQLYGDKPQQFIKKLDVPDTGAPETQLWDAATRGAGGALALPIIGGPAVQGANVVSGAMGGLGSQLAGNWMDGVDPQHKYPDWMHTAAKMAAAFAAGGSTAFFLGPRQTVGQQNIRESLAGTKPQDYAAAESNLAGMKAAGAKTATAAEAFPPNSGVMALARETRGSNLDNALRQVTVDRPTDLEGLSAEFLNRIKPAGMAPNEVATSVNRSADAISKSVDDARSAAMNAPMNGVFLPPAETVTIARTLGVAKQLAERQGLKDAYQAVIDNIMPGGKPIQRLSDLSLAITEAKPAMGNPNNLVNGASQVSPNDLRQAVGHARELLANASPEFKQGLAAYENMSKNVVAPFQTSSLDKLTSANPYNPSEGRIGQVGQVVAGNNPAGVRRMGADLAQAPGAPTSSLDIARALSEMKLEKGSTNPGAAVRGLAGSSAEQKLAALLEVGGKNPAEVLAPLNAADRLQAFATPAGHQTLPAMNPLQALLRPFRTFDMLAAGHNERTVNQEVARLLADNSPEAIRKLQEISMFDPNVRKMLVAKQAIPPLQENK